MPEKRHLPRLDRSQYKSTARIHWVITFKGKKTGWLGDAFHHEFERLSLHTTVRYRLVCPIYCLMPDHIHLIWMGLSDASGNQLTAMEFLRKHLKPTIDPQFSFQRQAFDHILRDKERDGVDFENACWYIAENPVRKELVSTPADWPYTGAVVPGYPDLDPTSEDYWPLFWRLFRSLSQPT